MMKPALYYAIRSGAIIAVTSEKEARHQWFGRYVTDNSATHGSSAGYGQAQLRGRFETIEAAEAMRDQLIAIAAKYDAIRKPHHDAVTASYRHEREAIEAVIANV
jgi:hypothetical protein